MQVFITDHNPAITAKDLDSKRLNKQILETIQIICANNDINDIWKIPSYIKNHPCTKLWSGYDRYLLYYLHCLLNEYLHRKDRPHSCDWIHYELCSRTGKWLTHNIIDVPDFMSDIFLFNMHLLLTSKNPEYNVLLEREIKLVEYIEVER